MSSDQGSQSLKSEKTPVLCGHLPSDQLVSTHAQQQPKGQGLFLGCLPSWWGSKGSAQHRGALEGGLVSMYLCPHVQVSQGPWPAGPKTLQSSAQPAWLWSSRYVQTGRSKPAASPSQCSLYLTLFPATSTFCDLPPIFPTSIWQTSSLVKTSWASKAPMAPE